MSASGRKYWKKHNEEYEGSGLTQEEYAQRNGLNAKTLSWWRWKLKSDGRHEDAPGFVPVRVVQESVQPQPQPQRRVAALRVLLPNGVVLELESGLEPALLARYAMALGGV